MVKDMKKLLLCLLCLFLVSSNKSYETIFVFNENDNSYKFYEISFLNKCVSTKNLDKYFEDIEIISVSPFINELYADKINFERYNFEQISRERNITRFSNKFISILEKNNYKNDALKAKINGIYIKKIVVYCSCDKINLLKNKLDFKYISF